MIDKNPVSAIGEVERDVFVRLFAAGPAVLVPHIDHLSIFDKGREALAKPVDAFAYAQIQLLVDIAPVRCIDKTHRPPAAGCNDPLPTGKLDQPVRAPVYPDTQLATRQRCSQLITGN